MKKHKIIYYILTAILAATGFYSCQDDTFNNYLAPGAEGLTDVELCVDYMPMSNISLSRSGGTAGNSMDDVRDMCIVVFDELDKCVNLKEINDPSEYKDSEVNRGDADASNGHLAGERVTLRRTIKTKLPAGNYYIYAVSNLTDQTSGQSTYAYLKGLLDAGKLSRPEFRGLRRQWDADILKNNSEMAGYFTQEERSGTSVTSYNVKEPTVSVQPGTKLYCWMRRLVSKVTVDFDATDLDPSTTIYLKDIRVRDIAYDCTLIEANKAIEKYDEPSGLLNESDNTQQILLCREGDDEGVSEQQYKKWPTLTAGYPTLDKIEGFAELKNITHSHEAPSLFFYENMQGTGKSKRPDAGSPDASGNIVEGTPDGIIDSPNSTDEDDPDYKDGVRAGTYVEVRAYYESTAAGNEGRGDITYRFMLGANTENDYNVERNHHYKLTLVFKGYANDYDWHVEYEHAKAPITIPNPYYISYGYNESLELPINVQGEIVGDTVTAYIIRNDWWPSIQWEDQEAEEGTHLTRSEVVFNNTDKTEIKALRSQLAKRLQSHYPDGLPRALDASDQTYNEGVSIGFLSLRKPHNDVVGSAYNTDTDKSYSAANSNKYLWKIWQGDCDLKGDEENRRTTKDEYGRKRTLGYRKYKVAGGSGQTVYDTDDNSETADGQYRIVVNPGTPKIPRTTTLYLPLYTRQRNLIKTMSHTGENPYNAYQRRAQVLYSFRVKDPEGHEQQIDTIIDIVQVCKIDNPTGVWRDWNNAAPFEVTLRLPVSYFSDQYRNLKSRGGWSAEVEYGNDWILLNGGKRKIFGGNMSDIEFTYRPAGILMNDKKVRCGIILVKYHNFTCTHRIFVRQGYAPIKVHDQGVWWHSYNMVAKGVEAKSPLDEGSMFRYGVWDYPIDACEAVDDGFKDNVDKEFTIAGKDEKMTWDKIKNDNIPTKYPWDQDGNEDGEMEVNGVKCRMFSIKDVKRLREGGVTHDTRHQYGVLYGDKSQRTATTKTKAFGYKGGDESTHDYGMRGCFVYHRNTGRQIFFPIGTSGFGHRKRKDDVGTAILRYCAGRTAEMPANPAKYMPFFYDLYRRPGAIYWSWDVDKDEVLNQSNMVGMDLNYFTFDFNTIGKGNVYTDGAGWDACFIRMVQDHEPK